MPIIMSLALIEHSPERGSMTRSGFVNTNTKTYFQDAYGARLGRRPAAAPVLLPRFPSYSRAAADPAGTAALRKQKLKTPPALTNRVH